MDIHEYPEGHKGPKRYVFVRSIGKAVPVIYTHYRGGYELLPEYGGPDYEESKHTGSGIQVMRDIGEYKSPVDGTYVTSRSQHREHIRHHDLIEVGNERIGHMGKPQDSGPRVGHDIQRTMHELRARN